jgi:hypothetical protein
MRPALSTLKSALLSASAAAPFFPSLLSYSPTRLTPFLKEALPTSGAGAGIIISSLASMVVQRLVCSKSTKQARKFGHNSSANRDTSA